MIKSIKDLVAELGGPTIVANYFAMSKTNAIVWAKRGSIPVRYWPKLMELAHSKEIELTAEILLRMCLNKPSKEPTIEG